MKVYLRQYKNIAINPGFLYTTDQDAGEQPL